MFIDAYQMQGTMPNIVLSKTKHSSAEENQYLSHNN